MKKALLLAAILSMTSAIGFSAFPYFEGFYPPIENSWEQFWTNNAILGIVAAGTDGISDSPAGTGYFLKSTLDTTGPGSGGHIIGANTDSDYNLKAYLYCPVVRTQDPPDDYLYQMLIFYRNSDDVGAYGRIHAHFNEDTAEIDFPRIRIQISTVGFLDAETYESPADFQHSEGWHEFKVEISGLSANSYYDGALLGNLDWSTNSSSRTSGKFGFGLYKNGEGARSVYVAGFKAYKGTEPPDPTPPVAADPANWTYYE